MCSKDEQEERLKLVSEEINISKDLCSNDKEKRKRGISSLKLFLSNPDTEVEENDYTRIWTGLFYYLWLSDKPLVQEETAERISNLLHLIKNTKSQMLFVRTCFSTLTEKWSKISTHRTEKFLMFIRRFLRQCLIMLINKKWEQEAVKAFSSELCQIIQILPLSLVKHLDDVFVEELAKTTNGIIETKSLVTLTRGFLECIANLKPSMSVVADIQTKIFGALSKQLKLAISEPPPEKNDNDLEAVQGEDESSEKENNVEDEEMPLDPRPGKVDVILPFIEFNEKLFVSMFESYADKMGVAKKARNIILILIDMFESITNLRKRMEDIRLNGPKEDAATVSMKRRKAEKEAMLKAVEKKKKNVQKRKRKSDDMVNKQLEELGDLIRIKGKNKKAKLINIKTNERIKKDKSEWIMSNIDEGNKENKLDIDVSEISQNGSITSNSGTWVITDITNNEVADKNESKNTSIDNANWTEMKIDDKISEESGLNENEEQNCNGNGIPEQVETTSQETKNNTTNEPETTKVENPREGKGKGKGRKSDASQDATSTPNRKKKSLPESVDENTPSRRETLRSYSSFIKGLEKEDNPMVLNREHPDWQTVPKARILECMDAVSKQNVKGNSKVVLTNFKGPIENGKGNGNDNKNNECLDEKDVASKSKLSLGNTETPAQNVRRKVMFTLDRNSSQGVSDYNTSLELNPNVPYSPAKEPNKGVLKPSAVASPINPFYRLKLARAKKRSLI